MPAVKKMASIACSGCSAHGAVPATGARQQNVGSSFHFPPPSGAQATSPGFGPPAATPAQMSAAAVFERGVRALVVSYGKKSLGLGRRTATAPSMQNCPSALRRALCRALYRDVDIVSCHPTLLLPVDFVCASAPSDGVDTTVAGRDIDDGLMGLDIGPASIDAFGAAIRDARTVVWNGPMGLFEIPPFDRGTLAVAKAMIDATADGATSVVGGGDTAAAVNDLGLATGFTHVSTGGGASLRMLEGGPMPGVDALDPA